MRIGGATSLLAALAACGHQPPGPPPPPPPRHVDASTIADDHLVDAVLDECQKPLRGRMDRIAAEVRLESGATLRVFANLPASLRCTSPEGQFLLQGEAGYRLDPGRTDHTVTAAERERLVDLRALLFAASFGPLHHAAGCRRIGPGEFELRQPTGPPWTMRLRKDTLLPEHFGDGNHSVLVLDYLRTDTTWMVQRASAGRLGPCEITFELADLQWDANFFAAPSETNGAAGPQDPISYVAQPGAEPRSPVPIRVEARAVGWVVLDDPGTWPERAAAYRPVHEELDRQDQAIAGFPIFTQEKDHALMAVPFRARDAGRPLRPPAGWRVRNLPASSLLVVYPSTGDFAQRCAAGASLLREAAAAQSLQAIGDVVCQPFLHLEDGMPPADKLSNPVVRVSLAVK